MGSRFGLRDTSVYCTVEAEILADIIPSSYLLCFLSGPTANRTKLETGVRPISAGIPSTLLLRIEAIFF